MRVFFGMGLVLVCAFVAGCGRDPSVGERRFPISDRDVLVMKVPTAWKQIDRSDSSGAVRAYTFTEGEGKVFRVTVTPLPKQVLRTGFDRPENIRELVLNEGTEFLPRAMESNVAVEELKAGGVVGYYFALTDRAPKPGEFKCMIEGARGFPQMLLMFTILTHDRRSEVSTEALAMIAGARVEALNRDNR